jgi:acyl carrier protein
VTADLDVDHRVRRLFAEALNIEVASTDEDLIDEGVLDSLLLIELLTELEQTFGIVVDTTELDIEDFRSVRSIGRFVTRARAKGRAP